MTNCPKLSLFFKETRNIYSYYLLQICSKMLALFLFFLVNNTSLINVFSIISSFRYIINTNKEFFCHLHNLFVFQKLKQSRQNIKQDGSVSSFCFRPPPPLSTEFKQFFYTVVVTQIFNIYIKKNFLYFLCLPLTRDIGIKRYCFL